MARTRRREDLTESWDDVDEAYEEEEQEEDPLWDEEEERDEMGSAYRSSARQTRTMNGSKKVLEESPEHPRRRYLTSSVEPELVMPPSPDGGTKASASTSRMRAATPRFRLNERSNTSDAGQIRKTTRAATPRSRMIERSMTSDAGRLRSSKLKEHDEAEYDSEDEPATAKYPNMIWQRVLRPLLAYVTSVAGYALHNLKPILGWMLLIYGLVAAMIFCAGFLTNSINNALSPVCRLPFTGSLPFCPTRNTAEIQGAAEFDRLVSAQDAFQDVLASTSVGVNLPLDMKRSEASIRDLKHVVEYSHLPSRQTLVFEFDEFIKTARQASQELSKFNSRIGRAVDHILSTNRWTLSVIDGVEQKEASKGAITRWVGNNLNIFAPFQPLSMSRDIILDQYLRHTDAVEEQIISLINEALVLQGMLNNMDERLDVIAGITTRDGIRIDIEKDELFATLWTKLGGNRGTVQKMNTQLELLRNVGQYRRLAWGHVTSTLLKLQEIQNSLEDLRERVAMPEVVGTDKVPLEVHIENIHLGIERLEKQRDASRQVEQDSYRKVLDRGEQIDRRGIGSKQEL